MKYLISNDKAYLDVINSRPFSNPSTKTQKLVQIAKHPMQDLWAAVIPDPHVGSVGERLTPEEAAQIVPALVDSLSDDWYVVIGSDPEIGDIKELVFVD